MKLLNVVANGLLGKTIKIIDGYLEDDSINEYTGKIVKVTQKTGYEEWYFILTFEDGKKLDLFESDDFEVLNDN